MAEVRDLNSLKKCRQDLPTGEETEILSPRHQEILMARVVMMTRSITAKETACVRHDTPGKLAEIHSSREFARTLAHRVELLYQMLFDSGYAKSRALEKVLTAGLYYFISPRDFLPDEIPGLGYLDDAYVIRTVWEKACPEIKDYIKSKGLDEKLYL